MFQWTDEYEKVNEAKTMSEFFKAFLRIPLAEQIKQLDADHMRSLANDLFWGQPYAGQNVETWQTSGNLPLVYDLDGVTVMDVETRLKGYETQLDECGRVIDMLGAGLNIDTLKELLPIVARNRAGTGAARDQVWDIDVLVNPTVAALIKRVFATVYKDSFGVQYTEQTQPGLQQNLVKNGVWANTYQMDEINLRLNVISGFWLEDMLSDGARRPQERGHLRAICRLHGSRLVRDAVEKAGDRVSAAQRADRGDEVLDRFQRENDQTGVDDARPRGQASVAPPHR